MKLAEALVERKATQEKIHDLTVRLQRVALIQEGETPAENPTLLLQELESATSRFERLVTAINQTNSLALLPSGQTITAALAQRDALTLRMRAFDTLLSILGTSTQRARGSEIRLQRTLDVTELQRQRDALARQYRELDSALQAANWSIDLAAEV